MSFDIDPQDKPGKPPMPPLNRKELAWAADLVQSISGREQFDAKGLVIAHGDLRTFLDSDESSKIIVSGARGMGKSIALAYKVSKLQASERYRTIPNAFPFMYGLSKKSVPLTGQQLYELGTPQKWTGIWLASLGVFLASWIRKEERRSLDASDFPSWAGELIEEANKWSGSRDEPFAAILRVAIKLASNQLELLFGEHLYPILANRSSRLALCVDSIDEAIAYSSASGSVHSLFSSQADVRVEDFGQQRLIKFGALARDAWIAAQQGYAAAAARITSRTGYGVLILGSLRLEARQQLAEQLEDVESKWESFIEDLRADKTDFQEIFEANIIRSEENRLVRPEATDLTERFAGAREIESRVVSDQKELLLDYILRHTFSTPRGMVQIGGAIYQKLPVGVAKNPGSAQQQTDRLVSTVNTCAADVVLKEHLSQLLPQLDDLIFTFAIDNINHNILSQVELARINSKYAVEFAADQKKLSDHLFAAGLLGIPRKTDGVWRQLFLGHSEAGFERKLPASIPFVVVHPALSARICQNRSENFYRSTFVVGSGIKCPEFFYPAAITLDCIDRGNRKQLVAHFEGRDGDPVPFVRSSSNVAYCFLFSLLFALHRGEASSVTADQIVEVAKDLSAAGLLSEEYGHPPEEPFRYLQRRLDSLVVANAKSSEAAIRELTSFFNTDTDGLWAISIVDQGVSGKVQLCFSIQSKLTSRLTKSAKQVFGDLDPLDIDVRIRLARRL